MAPCRFLVVLLLALTAAAPATQAAPLTVLTGRADGLVPAVQGTVSGRPLWLALDTGAHESFVDTSMVRDLALPTLGDTAITGSGKGQVSATKLKPVTFHLNDVTFTAQAPLATDLSNTGSAFTLGGILGFDFFSRYVVAIDFTSYRVSLYEPQSYRYDGSGVAIPLILRPPRAFVSVV